MMDKASTNGQRRVLGPGFNKNAGGSVPAGRSGLSVEGQTAIEYNIRMKKIKDNVQFDPNLVWSHRVRSWLKTSFDVRMLDVTGSTIYLISCASYLPENIYVYRNNTIRLPNGLYMFMVTNSSFGKSDFYRRYKHAIANCYQVKTTGEMLPRPNTNDEQVSNLAKCPCFIDDFNKLGLLNGLVNYPQLILADEADPFLIRNGLIPPLALPSNGGNDNFNINDIALQAYSGECCVLKSTAAESIEIKGKKLCILGNCTSESTMRLMRRKSNYEQPSPFVERSTFFWIPTPLTLEKFEQPQWPSTQPTEDQICMTLDVLCNIDFYFDDKSRYLIVSFGNAIMYEIYLNQNGDQWINNRLGKSREHTYRLAVNIQLIELAFALLDQYYYEHNHFNDHKADHVFRRQMIEIANKFLNRTDLSQRVSMNIHYEVVQSAINTVLMNINQYECFFSDCGLTSTTTDSTRDQNQSTKMNSFHSTTPMKLSSKVSKKQSNVSNEASTTLHHIENDIDHDHTSEIMVSIENQNKSERKRRQSKSKSLVTIEEEDSDGSHEEDYVFNNKKVVKRCKTDNNDGTGIDYERALQIAQDILKFDHIAFSLQQITKFSSKWKHERKTAITELCTLELLVRIPNSVKSPNSRPFDYHIKLPPRDFSDFTEIEKINEKLNKFGLNMHKIRSSYSSIDLGQLIALPPLINYLRKHKHIVTHCPQMAHFLANTEEEVTDTYANARVNDETGHTDQQQSRTNNSQQFVASQRCNLVGDQSFTHQNLNNRFTTSITDMQAASSSLPLSSLQQDNIHQSLSNASISSFPMSCINTQPTSTTVRETQTPISSTQTSQATAQVQVHEDWNSLQHHFEKFQQFMALHSAQLSSQSSSGFDASTVGHNRSITAMIHPPSDLPHAVDLFQNDAQQTPASLVRTRGEQRKKNQKKEAKRQSSTNSKLIQQKDYTSAHDISEGQSLNSTDE